MKIISLANQKGGVGKTTTALNLAHALTLKKKKVLLIDLDPQCNATAGIFESNEAMNMENNIYDLLTGKLKDIQEAIRKTDKFDIIPSSLLLAGADMEIGSVVGRETLLSEVLNGLDEDQYDVVIVDCPPSLGLLVTNAIYASDYLFLIIQTQYYALVGIKPMLLAMQTIKERLKCRVEFKRVICTMYDKRNNIDPDVLAQVQSSFGKIVCKTIIRKNTKLAEAPSFRQTIFEHEPKSNGAKDYKDLANELLKAKVI